MTNASQYFSDSYFSSREKFKQICTTMNLEIESYENPVKGPGGESLFVDATWIGPEDAEQVMLLISGTHGVEGFVGSACQIGWINSLQDNPLPENMAALVIHILNPFGCASLCVETEENIDLNRNFVDYSKPLPVNSYYEELHSAFTCPEYEGPLREQAELQKKQFIEQKGFDAFLEAAAKGQYQHADGFNFGGQQPAWSNRILKSLLDKYCSKAKMVAVVDYHTGLGEYGDAMLISSLAPDSAGASQLRSWYDDIHFSTSGDIGYETTGSLAGSIQQSITHAEVTAIVLEYGTYEIDRIASAMLERFWLSHFGEYSSGRGKKIQQEIKNSFYPDEPEWHVKTFQRSQQILNQAITGLQKM